jgi:hypothetical protein
MLTNLNVLSGRLLNTIFEPGTGLDSSLRQATNEPGWKLSANPSPLSISAEAVSYCVPRLRNDGLANTPSPVLTVNGASKMLLGSVIVIVGAELYADPGSNNLTANILPLATDALARAVVPAVITLALFAPVSLMVTNLPALFTLPNATPTLSLLLIVLEVHMMPSGELAAAVVDPTAKNVP